MLPGAIPCEAFDNGLRRKKLQLGTDKADIGFLFHRQQLSLPPKGGQSRAFQNVQQVELRSLGPQPTHGPGAFQHIPGRFAGKAVDQMDAGADAPFLQRAVALKKFRKSVSPADGFRRLVMDGLQAQLHRQICFVREFFQQIQHIRGQTIGPGGNAEAAYSGTERASS